MVRLSPGLTIKEQTCDFLLGQRHIEDPQFIQLTDKTVFGCRLAKQLIRPATDNERFGRVGCKSDHT